MKKFACALSLAVVTALGCSAEAPKTSDAPAPTMPGAGSDHAAAMGTHAAPAGGEEKKEEAAPAGEEKKEEAAPAGEEKKEEAAAPAADEKKPE